MTSPVKLPPLPSAVDTVRALFRGQPDYFTAQDSYYTMAQMHAYAEQAVREALEHVVQAIGRMAQEEFERPGLPWPTHMAYHQAIQSMRAIMPGSGRKPAPVDTSSGHSAPVDWVYTSAMGEAAQSYLDSFPYAHKLPAQFRWSDLWTAMRNAAPQASEEVRKEDVATVLNFIFEHFGKPFNACDLPGYVVSPVRRLEHSCLSIQPKDPPC